MENQSIWTSNSELTVFPSLIKDGTHVDVAIVGAGITGVTAGCLLKQAGKCVAVIDAADVGAGATGRTSAHVTEIIDTRYHQIERKFDLETARLVAESNRAAIEQIASNVAALSIDCGFERVPGFLFTENEADVDDLKLEFEAVQRAGITTALQRPALPFPVKYGLRFDQQAQFHVLRYLLPLALTIPGGGSHVFARSPVVAIHEGEPCRLHVGRGQVLTADHVIIATHTPLNRLLLQTKLSHYQSYVVSGQVPQAAQGLFWDTECPYHYIRTWRDGDICQLIVGGEDHKTGQEEDTRQPFARLATYAARLGVANVGQRWSSQVIESVDGLPFIGANGRSARLHVATGFGGNGITFGTLAAMILSDHCLGKTNRYSDVYKTTRKPLSSLAHYVEENLDFPAYMVGDALRPAEVQTVDAIECGDGKTVQLRGQRLAVHRDDRGALHAVSAVCTHLGCLVKFNRAERTWDCPCHGSRFNVDGSVLAGPAVRALKRADPQ